MQLRLNDNRVIISVDEFKDIECLVLDGIETDGDHHKKWYLQEIAKKLNIDTVGMDCDGIAP